METIPIILSWNYVREDQSDKRTGSGLGTGVSRENEGCFDTDNFFLYKNFFIICVKRNPLTRMSEGICYSRYVTRFIKNT